jgi:hypothetical protein
MAWFWSETGTCYSRGICCYFDGVSWSWVIRTFDVVMCVINGFQGAIAMADLFRSGCIFFVGDLVRLGGWA